MPPCVQYACGALSSCAYGCSSEYSSCLVACFIHVLRSPGHVTTPPLCTSCNFIPVQTWLTKLLLQSWLIDRECWLFLPTTILQSHKKINSHEFSVILNRRRFTHFVSLPLEWKFCGFVLNADLLSAAPEVALGLNGAFYLHEQYLRNLGVLDKGTALMSDCVRNNC